MNALIEKHLNASLTAEEAAALAAAMAADPALAAAFAAATRMDAGLREALREDTRTALYTRQIQRTAAALPAARASSLAQKPGRPLPFRRMGVAAGIAVAAGTGWWLLSTPPQPSPAMVAEKKSRAPRVMEQPAASAAFTGRREVRMVETARIRRALRQCRGAGNLRSVPVSQAIAALESAWREGADKELAAIPLQLADAVRQRYTRPGEEPSVSLELPGASLFAHLQLIAAQADLKTVVTGSAITLAEDPKAADAAERTWSLPVDEPALTAYLTRARSEPVRASWLPEMQPIVLTKSGITQPVFSTTWLAAAGKAQYFVEGVDRDIMDIRTSKSAAGLAFVEGQQNTGLTIAAADVNDVSMVQESGEVNHCMRNKWGAANCAQCHADQTQTWNDDFAARDLLSPVTQTNDGSIYFQNGDYTITADSAEAYQHAASHGVVLRGDVEIVAGKAGDVTVLDRNLQAVAEHALRLADHSLLAAEVNEDGYTIDLNLAPEVVEFEGFLNYGEPIQRWGEAAATPVESLQKILATHGVSAGSTWDAATAQLTLTGPRRQLQTAAALLEALRDLPATAAPEPVQSQ